MCFWKKSSSFWKECWPETWPKPFSFSSWGVGPCVHRWWGRMQWYLPWGWSPPPHHKPVWPDPGGLHLWVSARPHWVPGCCADSVVPSWQRDVCRVLWSWCFQAFPCGRDPLYQEVVYLQRTLNTWRKFLGQQEEPTYHHAFGDLSSYRGRTFWITQAFLRPLKTPWLLVFSQLCLFEREFSLCFVN